MSSKNQTPFVFNWQSSDPRTAFLPVPANTSGSVPSGTVLGAMASTNTIYSNIVEVSRVDNIGLEIAAAGTGSGTITLYGSDSGANWFTVTPSPSISQPAGSSGVQGTGINQYQHKYIMLKYVNASGTGTLAVYGQTKDLN